MRVSFTCILTVAFALLSVGCAHVTVRKVPTPTQYVQWTDDMQAKSDQMEGFRFYLPRPFVNVFESFPVRTDIYLALGRVAPDGKYVIVEQIAAESALSKYIAYDVRPVEIPDRVIQQPSPAALEAMKAIASAQSGAAQKAADAASEAAKKTITTGAEQPSGTGAQMPAPGAASGQGTTGVNRRDVKNDNGAFAYVPMRGNMDLVYMPDFEEQYVVSSQAGLGNASFQLNLGQGWSLQGFNSLTDNSELTKRIFDIIDTSIKLAKAAAQAALKMPAVPLTLGDGIASAQSDKPKSTQPPGTPVTLRITVVHYAARGLYPVIKPRELQQRIKAPATRGVAAAVFDMFETAPTARYVTEFDPTAIQQAEAASDNLTGHFTVPRYPYQYISFNTFRYISIEAVTTDRPGVGVLYDKTGTTGDPGNQQAVDLAELIRKLLAGGGGKVDPVGPVSAAQLTALEGEEIEVMSTPNAFKVKSAGATRNTFEILIDVGANPVPFDKDALFGALKKLAQKQNWANEQYALIDATTVNYTDDARVYEDAPSKKKLIEDAAKDAKVGSGTNEATDFFSAVDPVSFELKGRVLKLTPKENGTVTAKLSEEELASWFRDKVNGSPDVKGKAKVAKVELDAAAVTALKNAKKLKP